LRTFEQPGCFWISANARSCKSCIESRVFAMQVRVLLYAGSRPRALLRWVQFALKPATKTLGLHGVIIRGKGRKYVMADSAFKRMQVDACACWLDTGKHHRGVALRTSRALNCHEWNDGRQGLRLGHDASLKQAGAQHSLSPEMPGRRSGDCQNIRRQGSQTRVNSRTDGRKVSTADTPGAPIHGGLPASSIARKFALAPINARRGCPEFWRRGLLDSTGSLRLIAKLGSSVRIRSPVGSRSAFANEMLVVF
jgi:hypothetical protein